MLKRIQELLRNDKDVVRFCEKYTTSAFVRTQILIFLLGFIFIAASLVRIEDFITLNIVAWFMIAWVLFNALADIAYVLVMGVDEVAANKNRHRH